MKKFRVVILTSVRHGIVSECVSELVKSKNIEISSIVYSKGIPADRYKNIKRIIYKTFSIGLLGVFNGIRIRKWFMSDEHSDIFEAADRYSLHLDVVENTNSDETKDIMDSAGADLGLSLGNGYISERIFNIPRFGMINIHSELLPRFQGAQSIIWPIHDGIMETGFTIHCIDKGIDTGDILFRKQYPIVFHPALEETVRENLAIIRKDIPKALVYVCENFHNLFQDRLIQDKGRSYTTPSFLQFLRMIRNNSIQYKNKKL